MFGWVAQDTGGDFSTVETGCFGEINRRAMTKENNKGPPDGGWPLVYGFNARISIRYNSCDIK